MKTTLTINEEDGTLSFELDVPEECKTAISGAIGMWALEQIYKKMGELTGEHPPIETHRAH